MARQDFLSEFVLRELLAALGAPLAAPTDAAPAADSFSESLSEESESQSVSAAASGRQSRVMLVRRTNSSQQRMTLVDRHVDVQAFVPKHVSDFLRQTRAFQTLGQLKGSVVRVTKYHFATLGRCLEGSDTGTTSVSLSNGSKDGTRVYLYVDALAIVEQNDLAADPKPEVYSHSLVQGRLEMLSDAELEKQLMIHQGLTPLRAGDRFDDERPLLEEDCVIPEEQEQELEEDGWGLPATVEGRTDSELIEENGSVVESQVVRGPASQDELSTQDVTLSGNPSVGMSDESVKSSMDSQRFPFQQENIQETFVAGSDTEDEDDELETLKVTPSTQKAGEYSGRENASSATPTTANVTQNSGIIDLTADSAENATPESLQKPVLDQEPKVEDRGLEENVGGTAALAMQATPLESQKSPEPQTPAKGWGTLLRNLASNLLGTPSGEDSNEASQRESDESEEPATQLLDQPEEEEESTEKNEKNAEPEEFVSSQATVMLEYAMDNDENANAFEYEGMLSDELGSPRSVAHGTDNHSSGPPAEEADSANDQTFTQEADSVSGRTLTQWEDSANDLTLTQDWAGTVSPQKTAASREDDTMFKTPSPSAEAVTPRTEKRADVTKSQTSRVSTTNPVDSAHGHPAASHSNPQGPVLPSAKPKSPSNLVISVGSARNREGFTGPSVAEPRGLKRRHQQTGSKKKSPTTTSTREVGVASVPSPQAQTTGNADDHSRPKNQKRRRHEIPLAQDSVDDESRSPPFEQAAPTFPRQRRHCDRGNVAGSIYSLDAICQSHSSHTQDDYAAESDQERSSRQPRRAWKQYEGLFPQLNMARVTQLLAEQARTSAN